MYRVVVKFQAEGKEQLQTAVQGLEQLKIQGAQVNIGMQSMARTSGTSLEALARSGLRVGFMLNMVESAYMRQTMAMMMATNAQERYNTVVARYGRNSEEARQAARQLESQMQYLNLANTRANVSTALMIGTMAIQSGMLKKTTYATIAKTSAQLLDTVAQKSAILATMTHTAVTKAASAVDALHAKILFTKAIAWAAAHPYAAALTIAAAVGTAAVVSQYAIPSKKHGGYIHETGLYRLHSGETVIPSMTSRTIIPSSVAFSTGDINIGLEPNLNEALTKLDRKIRNAYRSEVG